MKIRLFLKPVEDVFKNLPVKACYLYGSQTGKYTDEKSDYDLAVFVEDKNKLSYRDLLSKIGANFINQEKLHLTVVDLTHTSPILLFQIISKGRLIYEAIPEKQIKLEADIMKIYFDDKHRQQVYYQQLKKQYVH